jgi:hypothetical protein
MSKHALDALASPSTAPAAAPVSEEEGSEGRLSDARLGELLNLHAPISHAEVCSLVAEVRAVRAPAPPPSTGDAPGPSEECHVEGCGWRWPRGSGLGCPQHPSPRAQTAPADDRFDCLYGCGIGVKADEDGCCATCGRDCVIVRGGVPTYPPMDEPDEPRAQTGTPDEGEPSDEILSNLLIRVRYAEEGKQDGILVSLDGVRLLVAAIRRLRSAALRREERP